MKKYCIISDFDGTLADQDHLINETTKEVIRKILDMGHHFYIATGRMRRLVENEALEIDPRVKIISANGGVVQLGNDFEVTFFDDETKMKVFEVVKKHNLATLFFNERDTLYYHFIPKFFDMPDVNEFEEDEMPLVEKIDETGSQLKNFNLINAFVITKHDDFETKNLDEVFEDLRAIENITVSSSSPTNIEIYPNTVSKGNAVKKVISYLNTPPNNVIVFGDGLNDISMLEVANISVAVANAHIEVQKVANTSTLANVDNGVAHFLLNYFK